MTDAVKKMAEALEMASREIEILREQVMAAAGRVATPKGRTSAQLKIDAALAAYRAEGEAMSAAIERDRSALAEALGVLKGVLAGREHLREPGRGSYAWDDERYQMEFGAALNEIREAIKPIEKIARDWTHCPTDPDLISQARARPTPAPAGVVEALRGLVELLGGGMLGEIIHQAFRKGADAQGVWNAIRDLPASEWRGVLIWIQQCLELDAARAALASLPDGEGEQIGHVDHGKTLLTAAICKMTEREAGYAEGVDDAVQECRAVARDTENAQAMHKAAGREQQEHDASWIRQGAYRCEIAIRALKSEASS